MSAIKKSLPSYSVTSFFSQIYTSWKILKGLAYSLIPVSFRTILISFLSFLSQKTYPGEFLRPKIILSRSYLRIRLALPLSSICHFLKMP